VQIASWNVNSIKARMHAVTKWLKTEQPDIVCLQETKTVDENFPYMEIEALGYNVAAHGQKSYNGVAVLSKTPFEEINSRLPGNDNDEQARYLEVVIAGKTSPVRVASIYLPNGNPAPTEIGGMTDKYKLKLDWMQRLKTHASYSQGITMSSPTQKIVMTRKFGRGMRFTAPKPIRLGERCSILA